MNTKEALERIIEGNFNSGYGFDLQMLIDCMSIVSKAIKDGEIISTQAIRDAIAEIEAIKPNRDTEKDFIFNLCISIIREHTGVKE